MLASLNAHPQDVSGEGAVQATAGTAAISATYQTSRAPHKHDGKQRGLLVMQVPRSDQTDRPAGLQRGEAFMLRRIRRMREGALRKQDQLGRVSRDQLACLLPRIAGEGVAVRAANKILGALEAP